ncbi:MAG: RNA-protein complex protein Nop10 [Candidatus Micrarchaeota archaeon]|nr:RNA-protein complex protein Nop10 [Candidatus Micrarchaeota archaeon]
MKLLKKCGCGNYSMRDECPACGAKTFSVHPPKYSPEDKFAEYRRKAKYGKQGE